MLNFEIHRLGKGRIARGSGAAIDSRHAGPSGLATVTMMALTPRGDGK